MNDTVAETETSTALTSLVRALVDHAQHTFGTPVEVSLASVPSGLHVRVMHKDVTVIGGNWTAVLGVTEEWRQPERGIVQHTFRPIPDIWREYAELVAQGVDFGVFARPPSTGLTLAK